MRVCVHRHDSLLQCAAFSYSCSINTVVSLAAAAIAMALCVALQMLRCVSRTSLATKLAPHLVEQLTDIVTDAVLTIRQPDQPLDLYMVRDTHGCNGRCQGTCLLLPQQQQQHSQQSALSTAPARTKHGCRPLMRR